MILLIDNYDSFTYNLVQRLGELDGAVDVRVYRNDQITVEQIAELKPSHVIISPGPCTPREAGVSNEVLKRFGSQIPILGVCLGHQCIGHVFGGEVVRNSRMLCTVRHRRSFTIIKAYSRAFPIPLRPRVSQPRHPPRDIS